MARRFESGDCVTVKTAIGTKMGIVAACRRHGRHKVCTVEYYGRGGIEHGVPLRGMQHCKHKVGRFKNPVHWDAQGSRGLP